MKKSAYYLLGFVLLLALGIGPHHSVEALQPICVGCFTAWIPGEGGGFEDNVCIEDAGHALLCYEWVGPGGACQEINSGSCPP